MGDFFRGWRRKVGVVTLMVALAFMTAWFRSIGVQEMFYLAKSDYNIARIVSTNASLVWERFQPEVPMFVVSGDSCISVAFENSRDCVLSSPFNYTLDTTAEPTLAGPPWERPAFPPHPVVWSWQWYGFGQGGCHHTGYSGNARLALLRIPYWAIVLTFTLLSAFLLLSKPRSSIQKKITEPVPSNGT